MRVLFLTSRHPARAPRGDQLRAYQQLRHLGARHAIHLVTVDDPTLDAAARADTAQHCAAVTVLPRARFGMALHAALGLFGTTPLQTAMYAGTGMAKAVDAQLRREDFDLAHVQLSRLGELVPRLGALPVVLDFVDALCMNLRRRAELDRAPWRWLAQLEARRLAPYERTLAQRVTVGAISSDADRQALGAPPSLYRLDNGFDLERFPFASQRAASREVLFVGNLGYFPNVDAVERLCATIFPRVLARVPDAHLTLVGARPNAAVRRAVTRAQCVTLVGAVPDVYPYFARAAVAVAPLRAGSGQQIKILEAMASGAPVVASATSAAGVDATQEDTLLIGHSDEDIAAAIVRLLERPAFARDLATRARAWVERQHSWHSTALELERLWQIAAASKA